MTLNLCHLLEVIENYIQLFIYFSWIFFCIARKITCNLNKKFYLYNYYKQYHNTKTEMKEGTFKNLFYLNYLVHKNKEISIYDENVDSHLMTFKFYFSPLTLAILIVLLKYHVNCWLDCMVCQYFVMLNSIDTLLWPLLFCVSVENISWTSTNTNHRKHSSDKETPFGTFNIITYEKKMYWLVVQQKSKHFCQLSHLKFLK